MSDPEKRVHVFLSPYYGWAIEKLAQSIGPDTGAGETPEIPKYDARGPARTGEVDFWTSKEVRDVVKSHLNYVVADTKVWEQAASYVIDTHSRVVAFVKNQGLGFAIPYLHDGQRHDYIPDFVIRLDNGVHLVLETKGFDVLRDVKVAAAVRWVDAVNAEGLYGEWRYAMAESVAAVKPILDET